MDQKSGPMERGLVSPITLDKQAKRGWQVSLNGAVVSEVASVVLVNSRFGELAYGLTPGGYDSWVFHEVGGGGAVMVPLGFFGGREEEPFIGLLSQERPNAGGVVKNLPRGFLDPGENHFQAAERETGEEVGLIVDLKERICQLGSGINPNSTFFVTSAEGEGVKFFALTIARWEVEPVDGEDEENRYRLKKELVKPVSKAAEGIMNCTFVPWKEAAESSDMFTLAGLGLVSVSMEYLRTQDPGY